MVFTTGGAPLGTGRTAEALDALDAADLLEDPGMLEWSMRCNCDTDHDEAPKDVAGCGARFNVKVTW